MDIYKEIDKIIDTNKEDICKNKDKALWIKKTIESLNKIMRIYLRGDVRTDIDSLLSEFDYETIAMIIDTCTGYIKEVNEMRTGSLLTINNEGSNSKICESISDVTYLDIIEHLKQISIFYESLNNNKCAMTEDLSLLMF